MTDGRDFTIAAATIMKRSMSSAADEKIRFDERVVAITGAGTGLGRAYALSFAERGAKLVVNNRRSAASGHDSAGELESIIRSQGGIAVAERSDVTSRDAAGAIVETALSNFGRLDALVLNAGLIEGCPVAELTEADLARSYEVNVLAAFRLTQAALPIMRRQNYGRIVFTTSTAGLYGNAGLAAYGMAKAAVFGLMWAVAAEEESNGILANTICPTALTRMTDTYVSDEALRAALSPDRVAPAVVWLASDRCAQSNLILMAAGGIFRSVSMLQDRGVHLRSTASITPEQVAAEMGQSMAEPKRAHEGLQGFSGADAHFSALLEELRS